MAKISNFIYCESTINEATPQGNKIHIVSPLQVFLPMFIPGMFSFSVVVGIIDLDITKPHMFKYILTGPDDNDKPLIDTGEIPLPPQVNVKNLPDDFSGYMSGMDFRNVVMRKEGVYVSEVFFDGNSMGKFPIKAKAVDN